MPREIDLDTYAQGVTVLAGRERGRAVREKEGLDALDLTEEEVVVILPEYLISVNSSFFLGMFETSVATLGEARFRKKYRFVGRIADETREDGIRTALLMNRRFRPVKRKTA